jgi:CheY-like chemotaxis protein
MPKILIIDDDQRIRMILRRILLEKLGWSVVEAKTGKEGLAVYDAEQPDIVALDLTMPEMNGDELLDEMRTKYGAALAQIFIISSETSRERLAPLVKQGISGYILKPFTATDVLNRLKDVFDKSQKK